MAKLCFGGSFNPIHHAHLICARASAEAGGFERVVLIPNAQPPHKPGAVDLAAPQHRLQMCRLAVTGDPFFEIDDLELRRTGPSYTIDTARELKARGWGQVHWLIGADMLRSLPTWHEALALLSEVNFLILARPGWSFDWDTVPQAYRELRRNVVDAPLIDISATILRRRVTDERSIAYLTPAPVRDYIRANGLYAGGGSG